MPADETIKMAIDARKKGVNVFAIALAGYEAKKEAKYFVDAFKKARAEGFQTLAHAGETLGPENIWQTIKELEVTRIGHGVRAVEDEQLLDYIARNEIVLEVCPWSNIYLGVSDEDHPIAKLDKHGIKIVIGSDDPGIFSKDLNDNYALSEKLGLKNLERIAKNSLELSKK